ncbi:MAG TPA: diaminopimelate epimerase [candidate division Zixibacteria bacterium]|nr:diaminopimelate epimerase [candidate division Zixibacteria bacterium]
MKIPFAKYHALMNDFLVVEKSRVKLPGARISGLVRKICHRKSGIGADGVLLLSNSSRADSKVDVYNADGGWAEKSGNGLRIVGLHLNRTGKVKKSLKIEMGGTISSVKTDQSNNSSAVITADIGKPEFSCKRIPVKSKSKYMIYQPLQVGRIKIPVTCLSMGNPHAVLFVNDFNFDWKQIGSEIEIHQVFPKCTNVEFVKIISRKKLHLAEWERGVGATGSSGTGAAAAVAAAVVLGAAERKCQVEFDSGKLSVNWRKQDNIIELAGPVEFVCEGTFEYL